MAAITASVVGGAVVSVGGSIIGGKMSANAKKSAARAQMTIAREASDNYENIDAPTVEEQMIELQKIKNSGDLTPLQEQIINQNESELKSIQSNPGLRDAQMQALRKLQEVGNEGGLTAVDKSQMNQIQNQVSNQNASNRNAVLQSYAQRGMGGSGLEQAAQLMGSQAASQDASNQGFNVAAQAQQRALQAIQQAGELGGGIEQQQFGQKAQIGQAQDTINRFNSANQQDVLGRNVQRDNYAQERNLDNQQKIDIQNTGLTNQQEVANKGLRQQKFNNDLQLAQGKANALNQVGNAAATVGNANSDFASAMGQLAAGAGSKALDYGLAQIGKKDKDKDTK